MSLTLFGIVFLAGALAAIAWRRESLLALLPIAAVLQAPAVVRIATGSGEYGVTAFNALMPLVAIDLLRRVRAARAISLDRGEARSALLGWLFLHGVAVVGALTLPFLFEGVHVHALMLREGLHQPTVPNAFTLSNVAQAVNAVGIATMFLWIAQWPERERVFHWLSMGLAVAFAISIAAAAHQRLAMLGAWPMGATFWGSNPGYNQYFHDPGFGPGFGRVGLPFPEPSYASVWFAAIAAAAAAAVVFVRGSRAAGIVVGVLATAALANTVGSSGALALAVVLPVIVACGFVRWPGLDGARPRRIAIACFACAGLAGAFAIQQVAWGTAPALEPLREAVGWTLLKFTDQVTEYRTAAMRRGIEVFFETRGFGVGTGSMRASSYFVSLLANLGAIGVVAFVYAAVRQYAPIIRDAADGTRIRDWPLLLGTACLLVGVGAGIAEQNWPVLWVVLMLGYARLRMRA